MFYFPIYPHTISRNQNQNVRQKIKMSVKRLASGLLPCRIPALTWIPGMPTVPCTRSLCASAPTLDGECPAKGTPWGCAASKLLHKANSKNVP